MINSQKGTWGAQTSVEANPVQIGSPYLESRYGFGLRIQIPDFEFG